MNNKSEAKDWIYIGESVRGALHIKRNIKNQDSKHFSYMKGAPVLAVSDGHGGAKHFRSDIGSGLAVNIAIRVLQDNLLTFEGEYSDFSNIKDLASIKVPGLIVNNWKKKLDVILRRVPFTEIELETLKNKKGADLVQSVLDYPYLAFGATLLCVLIHNNYIIYFQLGDGEIVSVYDQGKIVKRIFNEDEKLGDQTYSLCMKNPEKYFKVKFQTIENKIPDMIMLSTDGYINSFNKEDGFLKAASDIYNFIQEQGVESVKRDLTAWLSETSERGSGDDITMGLLLRKTL